MILFFTCILSRSYICIYVINQIKLLPNHSALKSSRSPSAMTSVSLLCCSSILVISTIKAFTDLRYQINYFMLCCFAISYKLENWHILNSQLFWVKSLSNSIIFLIVLLQVSFKTTKFSITMLREHLLRLHGLFNETTLSRK